MSRSKVWPRSKVWEQVYRPSRLPFETLDSFLAVPLEPPEPWVLVDLADIWVPNKGVPAPVSDEIERLALRAMKMCTEPEEWLWAWNAPDEYSDQLYRLRPHRVEPGSDWEVVSADGVDQVFVSKDLSWGMYAHFMYEGLEAWALRVFGERLLEALSGHGQAGGHRSFSGADRSRGAAARRARRDARLDSVRRARGRRAHHRGASPTISISRATCGSRNARRSGGSCEANRSKLAGTRKALSFALYRLRRRLVQLRSRPSPRLPSTRAQAPGGRT